MNFIKFRNKILCILLILTTLFSTFNIGYAGNAIDVSISLPAALQVYKPGDIVQISGTAKGLGEVAVTVRNANNKLIFAAQPKVINGGFADSFTLDANAPEGKYTLVIGSIGLSDLKRNFVVNSSGEAKITIEKPGTNKQFKPGEEIEIAGTAQNVDAFTICVRNSKGGRVFIDQPSIAAADGAFSTKFSLPDDTISGQYNLSVNTFGLTNTVKDAFTVVSSGSGEPGKPPVPPVENAILTIGGSGVKNEVSFTLNQLQAMEQKKVVFSVTSDLPEDLVVAAQGVSLNSLLNQAGLKNQAKMIIFTGTDGYTAKFTVDELLNQNHYIFPGKEKVEPLIALKRAERTSDYSKMHDSDAPILCFGQRAATDQTLFSFVKYVKTITVTTETPAQWAAPKAQIAAPDSKTKVSTTGGKVKSGSDLYFEYETGGKIYYTTDGSTPDINSTLLNIHGCGPQSGQYDPIKITKNTTVKAKIIGRGKTDSQVATYQFSVDGSVDVPTVIEQKVEEANIKRTVVDLGNGRKEEKITLLAGFQDDINKAVNGSSLVTASTSNADQVRLEIPAGNLKKAKEKGMLIGMDSQNGKYTLPLSVFDFEKMAVELGTKSDSLTLNVVISKVTAEDKKKLAAKVGEGQQMISDPVEFSVVISAPDGKKKDLSYFGGTYVERYIGLSGDTNSNKAIGVVWDDEKGRFTPVPTRFETKNGKKYAVILSRTNSKYTVLQSNKAFTDIAGNWAKGDIELLASKMLISGRNETLYAPKSNVTRAEFAALLVRALGLAEGTLKDGQYKDVDANAWYAGSVAAATQEKIITGYAGDLFKPNNNITREEMAVMINRAASVAGKKSSLSESDQKQMLAKLSDHAAISSWAKQDVALAVNAGIIKGMSDQSFSPATNADRAQSAAILKRFLVYVNFMN